jgi:uncharacterized protein (TIGR03435 family)
MARSSVLFVAALLVGALTTPAAQSVQTARIAQSPESGASRPSFEVASIRRNVSTDQGASVRPLPGGGLTITNNTLFNIIRNAYNVQPVQIIGGPDWINRDRWDIVAKAEGNPLPPQLMVMLQGLVAERFKADVRRETREIEVYALTVARADRRLGPQLTSSSVDCDAVAAAVRAGGTPPPARPNGLPTCGMRVTSGYATAGGYAIADIARNLAGITGRIILDRTGLAGRYDMELKWTPDPLQASGPAAADTASIFTALQEQLGLKLEAQRAPTEVLVIHAAERPVED